MGSQWTMLAEMVEGDQRIQPDARRAAIAATLREIGGGWGVDYCAIEHTVLAFQVLALPRDGDDQRVAARRRTCGEIAQAAVAAGVVPYAGDAKKWDAHSQWNTIANNAATLTARHGSSERERAIAETLRREADELAVRPASDRPPARRFRVPLPCAEEGTTRLRPSPTEWVTFASQAEADAFASQASDRSVYSWPVRAEVPRLENLQARRHSAVAQWVFREEEVGMHAPGIREAESDDGGAMGAPSYMRG